MSRKVTLLVSPTAGGGKAVASMGRFENSLVTRGIDVTSTVTESIEHAAEAAGRACEEGQVAIAVGGDGLVNCVAGAVSAGNGAMGLIPMGRGNDFARALGITKSNALDVLAGGHERVVDLGAVNGRVFTCVASFGFDSTVVARAEVTRAVRGPLVYPYATVAALRAWSPVEFTIEIDESVETFTGFSVAVANGDMYGGGMRIAPDASLTDGLLDVVAISDIGKLQFLRLSPRVYRGTHVAIPEVRTWKAKRVRLSAQPEYPVIADGERMAMSPVEVVCLPRSLRVVAP